MEATVEQAASDTAFLPHEATHSPHPIAEIGKPFRITSETAKERSMRRWDKFRADKEAKRNPVKTAEDAEKAKAARVREDEERELKNARKAVALLSTRLLAALSDPEMTPVDIERLQRSLSSAREDERKLAGRSLPPTVKATQAKPSSRRA